MLVNIALASRWLSFLLLFALWPLSCWSSQNTPIEIAAVIIQQTWQEIWRFAHILFQPPWRVNKRSYMVSSDSQPFKKPRERE